MEKMPTCPHCKKIFTFHEIGIDNILEGKDAEEFRRNEHQTFTPEQIEFFKKAKKIYKPQQFL
jgi:hypothetical protein